MIEKNFKNLAVFKQIVSELRRVDKTWSLKNEMFQFLKKQMREYKVTQKLFGKAPNEVEYIANCYATYLTSSRKLQELQKKYAGAERKIEESANLVGLKLPDVKKK